MEDHTHVDICCWGTEMFKLIFSPCIKTIELWQTEALVFVIVTNVTWIFSRVSINYIAWWMDVYIYMYILHLKEEF